MTDTLVLSYGDHARREDGVCAMEAVAWLAGETHSYRPQCTCPVITAYVIGLNDAMPDEARQRLVPYLDRLIGTVDPSSEKDRGEFLAWQAIRVFAPTALTAEGLEKESAVLRNFLGTLEQAAEAAQAFARYSLYDTRAIWCILAEAINADAIAAADAAAGTARYAAIATAAADDANAKDRVWDAAIAALEGVLDIGKQASQSPS